MKIKTRLLAIGIICIQTLYAHGAGTGGEYITTDKQIYCINSGGTGTASVGGLDPNPQYNVSGDYPVFTGWEYSWSGDVTGDTTGATVSLDLSSSSASEGDKTVSVTITPHFSNGCEPPETISGGPLEVAAATFTVCEIQSFTPNSAPDGTSSDREEVGVGEFVHLNMQPAVDVTWKLGDENTVGNDGRMTSSYSASTVYTAAGSYAWETITATFDSGDSAQISFNVVAPSYETATKISENVSTPECTLSPGEAGVMMEIDVTVNPTNVSFSNVEMIEISGYASDISGYFEDYDGTTWLSHNPKSTWTVLTSVNTWSDEAGFFGYPSPWRVGKYVWDIPVQWRVTADAIASNPFGDLPNRWQQSEITGNDGNAYEWKLEQSATRLP